METSIGNGQTAKQAAFNPIANLKGKGWKKGQSGNPNGRPRRKTFTELAYEYLGGVVGQTPEGDDVTRLHQLVEALVDKAVKGHNTAIIELLDRIDHAPKHSITINNNVPAPVIESLRRIGIDQQETIGA